jgi:hypothetical protein
MNPFLRLALCAVLAWQAVAGAIALFGDAFASLSRGYGERLTATTDERIASTLGADHPLYRALRELPAGAMVLTRQVALEAATLADAPRLESINTLLNKLRHLLYPDPFVAKPTPDPIAIAEAQARAGQPVWLLVLPDDPEPAGRTGWTRQRREDRFQLWRLQKE